MEQVVMMILIAPFLIVGLIIAGMACAAVSLLIAAVFVRVLAWMGERITKRMWKEEEL